MVNDSAYQVQVSSGFITRNRVWEGRGVHVFSFFPTKKSEKVVVRITKKRRT
jgi:hypothetical protein